MINKLKILIYKLPIYIKLKVRRGCIIVLRYNTL